MNSDHLGSSPELDRTSLLQERVKELAEHHGSIRAAARVLMVDHAYLYRLSTGEKDDPGDDLLRKLKLRRVVAYVRTDVSGSSDDKEPSAAQPTDADWQDFAEWASRRDQMVSVESIKERCARVCEQQATRWTDDRARYVAHECASAIRGHVQKPSPLAASGADARNTSRNLGFTDSNGDVETPNLRPQTTKSAPK